MKSSEILYKNIKMLKKMLAEKKSYGEISKSFEVSRSAVAGFIYRNLKTEDTIKTKKESSVRQVFKNPVTILSKPAVIETVNQCKFLYGNKVPYTRCEKDIVKGSYCQEHNKLCYTGVCNARKKLFKSS